MLAKLSKFLRDNGIFYNWRYHDKSKKIKSLTTDWVKNRDASIDFPLITVFYDKDSGYVTVTYYTTLSKNMVQVHFICGSMDTFLRKLIRYNIISIGQLKKLKSVKTLT